MRPASLMPGALSTPEEFGRLIESEMQRWGKLVRALNLKPE